MSIHILYDGIDGDSTTKGFDKHIDVTSLHYGVGRAINMGAAAGRNRESTLPSVSEITFTKTSDIASVKLFLDACGASPGKKVIIKFAQTGTSKTEPNVIFKTITLEEVLISGFSSSADEHGEPVETISLAFNNIFIEYTPNKGDHSHSDRQLGGYDVSAGEIT